MYYDNRWAYMARRYAAPVVGGLDFMSITTNLCPTTQGYLAVFALGFQAVHFVATRHLVHITR